jgi:hypothetical protein
MGSQVSSDKKNGENRVKNHILTSNSNILKEQFSSYNGLKTEDCSSNSDYKEINCVENAPTKKFENNMKEIKIPTLFKWTGGGNSIFLTGSFSNWSQWFLMCKVENSKDFELTLV